MKCPNCKIKLRSNNKTTRQLKYCSYQCQQDYKLLLFLKRWGSGKESGMKGEYNISSFIRRYLFKKYKNKCCKCGWSKKNKFTGRTPLEINHKDGNFRNNKESNLELICPNCHSLTKSFRNGNKGNGRKARRKYD